MDLNPHGSSASSAEKFATFRHLTAERAGIYRAILEVFATARRQFRIPYLRPDEIAADAHWPGATPAQDEFQQALAQLVDWGNLVSQPDTARVGSIEDFYRARFLYRLSHEGEAVEAGLIAFEQALRRRGELQSVALEDIQLQLLGLLSLAVQDPIDAAKVHEVLRDLAGRFGGLAESAQAFMAGLARSMDLQRADVQHLMLYKKRLMDYLERFIGDLVTRSTRIADLLRDVAPHVGRLLGLAAEREARDAVPGDPLASGLAYDSKLADWRERWGGLERWFLGTDRVRAQAEILRARARAAIPQLLAAIAALNERRAGKSDRSADFRILARWFAECDNEGAAHRLWRATFALSPARHLVLRTPETDVPAHRSWGEATPVTIEPRLRERGSLAPRGAPPKIRDRSAEREHLGTGLAEQQARLDAARARLATGQGIRLSELGPLTESEFRLLLTVLGEAVAAQATPDDLVHRSSQDGLLSIRLEPLSRHERCVLETELGRFGGRDQRLTLSRAAPDR